jgi:hypothetical protein
MLFQSTLPQAGSRFLGAVALLVKKGGTIHRRSGLLSLERSRLLRPLSR